jgi:hypothetical protein
MKHRLVSHSLTLLALFLALVPNALANNTWYVDGVNGSDNNNCKTRLHACKTIGHAISLASSGDSIMVAAATYKENLTIRISLRIVGSPAGTTIIDGGGVNRVVRIPNSGARVTLSKLTIYNGLWTFGGGIYNNGTLTINSSLIAHNLVHGSCHHINCYGGDGGGIYNDGTLTINNSTISGNAAHFLIGPGLGGGIFNDVGTLTINNSTISGNEVEGFGGGIYGSGTIQNSIVANNSGGNCTDHDMISNGYNLSSDGTCNFNSNGDLNNTDPKLGQLGNHGGPTQTIPLLSGSPAIDAGNPSGCTDGQGHLLKTDQRGMPRPDKEDAGGCDMGAYERQTD